MNAILTLLHFNVQYCAGGLEGLSTDPDLDASDEGLQDRIIEESLAPVLDVLDEHPTWTFDIELQGYMIEVMAERHPDVLDHLRTLAKSGQVELISFHWSDQLWTAFPATDMAASVELTRQVFEDQDLPLSDVVFSQEGQFSQGMLDRMPEWGYRVAVLPSNLAGYLWGSVDAPLYRTGDVLVLPSTASGDRSWSFLNDGELWATNGRNCYLGTNFVYDPDSTAESVAELEADEAAGAQIAGIGAYVDAVATGDEPELPAVLDGTWQPDDTDDLGLWMGGSGLWGPTETDNGVRTANIQARAAVLAAQSVEGADPDFVEAAWRELLLAEVSDATGWNPYETEVQYGLDHSAEAARLASFAIASPCLDEHAARVHVVSAGDDPEITWDPDEDTDTAETVDGPADLAITTPGRHATLSWSRDDDGYRLDVAFEAGDDAPEITFPWDGGVYGTVPALGDALVEVDADDITADGVALPLSWGLAELGGGWTVVKRLESVHLAGIYSRADGTLSFRDETASADALTWSFQVFGPDDGDPLAFARDHNVYPTVDLYCPGTDAYEIIPKEGRCGCASSSKTGIWSLLLGLLALSRRRARP